MEKYRLPDLSYDYGALEPHISGEIMELHHDKHHRDYVEKANKTLESLAESRERGMFERIAGLEKALAFNLGGHVLHSIFWQNLSPDGGGRPEGELMDAIQNDFGGFEPLKKQMTHVAMTTMGSGWAALEWEIVGSRLMVSQIHDHQSNTPQSGIPLLVLDAWEHAYYLQYRNQKKDFFEAVWNLWNWEDVAHRFARARDVDVPIVYQTDGHDEKPTIQPPAGPM